MAIIDYPRDNRQQRPRPTPAMDIAAINRNIAAIYDWVNQMPGIGAWHYPYLEGLFKASWTDYFTVDTNWQRVRFRREMFDVVRVEGLARQSPYSAVNLTVFVFPRDFIPLLNFMHVHTAVTTNFARVDVKGLVMGATAGAVTVEYSNATQDYVDLNFQFTLT